MKTAQDNLENELIKVMLDIAREAAMASRAMPIDSRASPIALKPREHPADIEEESICEGRHHRKHPVNPHD